MIGSRTISGNGFLQKTGGDNCCGAYDPRFKRQVAVKVLPRQFTHDPKFLSLFEREATTIAGLEHPAIVPVYDFGDQEDSPYLVMRYMPGGSLAEKLGRGPLSLAESARIMRSLAPALDKAHQRGIIHRDLKPGNVLFDEDDQPYLADFGIARIAEATHTMTIIGTPAYMSPEQVRGKIKVDGRSDIYAMGVMFFEMLTGHKPYEADTPSGQMVMHLIDPIPDIASQNPDLGPRTQMIIDTSMAKDRDRRYQTAAELAAAAAELVQKPAASPVPLAADPIADQNEVEISAHTTESVAFALTQVDTPPELQPPRQAGPGSSAVDLPPESPSSSNKRRETPSWIWWLAALPILALIVLGIRGIMSGVDEKANSIVEPSPPPAVVAFIESKPTASVEPLENEVQDELPTPVSAAADVESTIAILTREATEVPQIPVTATAVPLESHGDEGDMLYDLRWASSGHADAEAEAFIHWNEEGEIMENCAKCHSTPGYLDFIGADGSAEGIVDKPAPIGSVIDCDACHNDVSPELTSVTFPSGYAVPDLGLEADCMRCHQGRQSIVSMDQLIRDAGLFAEGDKHTVSEELYFLNIHYLAAAATQYGGGVIGGNQYPGRDYLGLYAHVEEFDSCIECHDAHTLEIAIDTCAECHEEVRSKADLEDIRETGIDFDGDGDTSEGIQGEIETMRAALYHAIQDYASETSGQPIFYTSDLYPYFFVDGNNDGRGSVGEAESSNRYDRWTPSLLRAAYNYQVAKKDPGAYSHNALYIIQLLYDSIEDINGDTALFIRPN